MAQMMLNGFNDKKLSAMLSTAEEWCQQIQDDEVMRQNMFSNDRIDYSSNPVQLRGNITLKKFQAEGVQWLLDKYIFKNSGAILGDEMGLGKTLEVVAYIAAVLKHWEEKDTPARTCPQYTRPCFLIIAPLSVLNTWTEHIEKFCPDTVSFIPYYGNNIKERDEIQDTILNFRKMVIEQFKADQTPTNPPNTPKSVQSSHPCVDIILTTYETLLLDKDFLTQFHYTNVIVDEAHRVKNPLTSLFGLFKRVPYPYMVHRKHSTLLPASQFDFTSIQSAFFQQLFPPLSLRLIEGNGNPMYSETSLEANKKQLSKTATNDNKFLLKQYVLSYDSAILLTGTLVQNNTLELWTLLHIVLPKFFPINSLTRYNQLFEMIGMHNFTLPSQPPPAVELILKRLQFVLAFCFLRRTKTTVDINLPPKTTYVVFSGLTSLQKRLYRSVLGKNCSDLLACLSPQLTGPAQLDLDSDPKNKQGSVDDKTKKNRYQPGRKSLSSTTTSTTSTPTVLTNQPSTAQLSKSLKSLNSVWISLRKIINHSYLIPGVEPTPYQQGEHLVSASGKLILLDSILGRILPKGHRVLIFSTSTEMLDILQDFCDYRGYNIARLDGSIRGTGRGEVISSFQNQTAAAPQDPKKRAFSQLGKLDAPSSTSTPIFLLSTRAAGVGITLTAADTVIFYESDFNQAVDQQAEQRCYRIGQDKPVLSLRLICRGSIEHLYYLRNVRKAALSDAILQEGRFCPKKIQQRAMKAHNKLLLQSGKIGNSTSISTINNIGSNLNVDNDDDDDDDHSYVNIIVPDELMQGDQDNRSTTTEAERVTVTHTKVDGSTFTSSVVKKGEDFQGDKSAMEAALNCLISSNETANDNEDVSNGIVDRHGNVLDEARYEKKHSMLYKAEDLDWITTQGYSPNWDPVTKSIVKNKTQFDDGFIDRHHEEQIKKRIGGLSHFMNAASVEQARQQRSMPVLSTKPDGTVTVAVKSDADQDVVDGFFGTTSREDNQKSTSRLFDTTNIPTMRLVAFQDLVTTDMDKDEAAEKKKIKNAMKSGLQIAQPQNPQLQQFLLDLQHEINQEDDGTSGNNSDNDVLESKQHGVDMNNILLGDSKRSRPSIPQTDIRSFVSPKSTNNPKPLRDTINPASRRSFKLDDSDDDLDSSKKNSKPTTNAISRLPKAQTVLPVVPSSTLSNTPLSRAAADMNDMVSHFQEQLNNFSDQYEQLKARCERFSKKHYISPVIYNNQHLIMVLLSHLRPSILPFIFSTIYADFEIQGLNQQRWDKFIQRYIQPMVPPQSLSPTSSQLQFQIPDYIRNSINGLNNEYTTKLQQCSGDDDKKKEVSHQMKQEYTSVFHTLHEHFNSSLYLREAIYYTYHYSVLYSKCNYPINTLVQNVLPHFVHDIGHLVSARLVPFFSSIYQPTGVEYDSNGIPTDRNLHAKFSLNQHLQLDQSILPLPLSPVLDNDIVTKNEFILDIMNSVILVAIENVMNELSLLLHGVDNGVIGGGQNNNNNNVNMDESHHFYTFIPLQKLFDTQIGFPFLSLPKPSINSVSDDIDSILTQDDLSRWVYSTFVVYNPDTNDSQEYSPSPVIKNPYLALASRKKRKFRINHENVTNIELALQYSLVYSINSLTPPLEGFPRGIDIPGVVTEQIMVETDTNSSPLSPINNKSTDDELDYYRYDENEKIKQFENAKIGDEDDMIDKMQPKFAYQSVTEYRHDADRLINDSARLHHVSGNMLHPHLTLGCPRSALFEPLFSLDFNYFLQGPISHQSSTTSNRFSNNQSPDADSSAQQVTMSAPYSPLSRANGFIILNFSDNSGQFGRGRLFSSLQQLSPELADHYGNAKEMRELSLGSVVISPIPNPTTHNDQQIRSLTSQLNLPSYNYIANVVVMNSTDRTPNLEKINEALNRVLLYAKLLNLVIIAPKQGFSTNSNDNTEYYTFEKLLTNKASLYNVHCCIFHYSHTVRRDERSGGGSNTTTTSHGNTHSQAGNSSSANASHGMSNLRNAMMNRNNRQ